MSFGHASIHQAVCDLGQIGNSDTISLSEPPIKKNYAMDLGRNEVTHWALTINDYHSFPWDLSSRIASSR